MIDRLLGIMAVCVLVAAPAAAQEVTPVDDEPAASEHAATAAAAAAPAPMPATSVGDAGNFQIGPEDVLDIQVWKNDDLSRVVPVRPDGRISLPLVNDIMAAGLTPTELRAQITERLAPFVPSAEVSVIVREVHSFKVSIVGAVRMPGTYEVKSTATVLDIIARAQGLTEFARRDRIVVHRGNGGATTTQLPFDYERVAEGKDENLIVHRGDIIVVP
jgi:polysaccharide export outer membrane protein